MRLEKMLMCLGKKVKEKKPMWGRGGGGEGGRK